jgi:hypothetical protein
MQFYIRYGYYGGDVDIIEQAAKDCNAQLLAVNGYALDDYPGDRAYVEGQGYYILSLKRDSLEEARRAVDTQIRERVRILYCKKYPEILEQEHQEYRVQ